eukprot:scaffold13021_cov127-Isochrysis_galbana.AAC.7
MSRRLAIRSDMERVPSASRLNRGLMVWLSVRLITDLSPVKGASPTIDHTTRTGALLSWWMVARVGVGARLLAIL